MKKLLTSAAAAAALTAGLLVAAGGAAQAASCQNGGYPAACPKTTTKVKAPASVKKGKQIKIKVNVKPQTGNVKPTGKVKVVCRYANTRTKIVAQGPFNGTKKVFKVKLRTKGKWTCQAKFTGTNAANSASTTTKITVR